MIPSKGRGTSSFCCAIQLKTPKTPVCENLPYIFFKDTESLQISQDVARRDPIRSQFFRFTNEEDGCFKIVGMSVTAMSAFVTMTAGNAYAGMGPHGEADYSDVGDEAAGR
jgi:hypothetical protein